MTQYHDHYFDTADANAFLPLLATQANIIGPMWGQAEAGADPARVYIAVRSASVLATPAGAQLTPLETGVALLGVWA